MIRSAFVPKGGFGRLFCCLLFLLALVSRPALSNDLAASTWSEVDAANNAASPNGWTSGSMLPSQVEPVARAMMGAIKRFYDHITPTAFAAGTANALTLTYAAPPASLANECFRFYPSAVNTAAVTLDVNGLGAKAITVGGADLVGGEFAISNIVLVCYNGTNFQLLGNEADYITWTSYTPVPTCGGGHAVGAYTSGGRYKIIGKVMHFSALVNLSLVGTCTNLDAVLISLPTGTVTPTTGSGGAEFICPGSYVSNVATFTQAYGDVIPGTSNVVTRRYDGSIPALNGDSYSVSCTVEIQ